MNEEILNFYQGTDYENLSSKFWNFLKKPKSLLPQRGNNSRNLLGVMEDLPKIQNDKNPDFTLHLQIIGTTFGGWLKTSIPEASYPPLNRIFALPTHG
jgi:hypothetical protein